MYKMQRTEYREDRETYPEEEDDIKEFSDGNQW